MTCLMCEQILVKIGSGGKPSVKGGYVTYLYLFTCAHETFFWDCILEQPLNRFFMVDGLKFLFSYKLVPFCYVIYEKTN